MTTFQMAEAVKCWFSRAEGQVFGPLLPDGWFGGRPGESIFYLRDVRSTRESLVVQLSDNTALSLIRPRSVFLEDSELVFPDFDEATFSWIEYGGTAYREKRFVSGEIRFAPPIGCVIDNLFESP